MAIIMVMSIPLAVIGRIGFRLFGIEPYVSVGEIRMARYYWLYDYTRSRRELGLDPRPPQMAIRDTIDWLTDQGYYEPGR